MSYRKDAVEKPKKQTAHLGIRLYAEEKGLAERVAVKERLTVSELVRFLIHEEARKMGVK